VVGAAANEPPVRLVVGLGNPEPRYARTRHNAGQLVVEELAKRLGVRRFAARFAGRFAEARGPAGPLGILIPTTYMNLSGQSVGPAAGSLRAAPGQVLVVHDDLDLAFGRVQGKVGGGTGGHNGLKSIRDALGSGAFLRVRLGIGRPGPGFRGDEADWVLQAFSEPRDEVIRMLETGLAMTEVAIAEGMESAIARFHAREPGSRAKAREERRQASRGAGDTPEEPAS
jgi:PTH1 family peptidyl-tRNA hydrolase